jgi:hypothetical protein
VNLLNYLFLAFPFLVAIGFALALVVLVVTATRRPWPVLGLLACAFVAETASLTPLALKLGLWIYPGDLVAVVAALALGVRVLLLGEGRRVPAPWWIFGAVQFALFAWGLAAHGTGAGVDYRSHFTAWAGAAYLATFDHDPRLLRGLLGLIRLIAVAMVGVAVFRWTYGAVDWRFGLEVDQLITTGVPFRVIWAAPTFMIALAMLASIHLAVADRLRGGAHWPLALLLGACVLVLQHRSVWVAALGGTAVLVFQLSRARSGVAPRLAGAVLALAVVAAVGATSLRGVSESVQAQAERAVSSGGTFQGGRLASWGPLLKTWATSGSPVTYLVGRPFGSGYERYTSSFADKAVTYQPHNYYVHLLYRGGLVGLGCFLWVLWQGVATLRRQAAAGAPDAPLLLAFTAALALFYIPYAVSYDHALLLGMLLAAIARGREAAPAAAGPRRSAAPRLALG